ncbi:MAG: DUF3224 domain-containing protein, partial [Solirubrobacterales bacterium]
MPHAIATFTNEIYEQEPGKLGDREGAFVLQHYGTISSEGSEIAGAVVPGSGTGELDGLSGEGTIA